MKDLIAWGQFDRSILDKLAQAGVPVHFHILPQKQFKKDWEQEYALTIINGEKGKTVYFVVAGEDPLPGEVPVPESSVEEKKALLEEKKTHFKKTLRRMAGAVQKCASAKVGTQDSLLYLRFPPYSWNMFICAHAVGLSPESVMVASRVVILPARVRSTNVQNRSTDPGSQSATSWPMPSNLMNQCGISCRVRALSIFLPPCIFLPNGSPMLLYVTILSLVPCNSMVGAGSVAYLSLLSRHITPPE